MLEPPVHPPLRHSMRVVPTSVCVVAAHTGTTSAGMTVGSFTSVSLSPPLVAFWACRDSRTVEVIEESGTFCANVLGAGQAAIGHYFAAPRPAGLGTVPWVRSPELGVPVLEGVVAWFECRLGALTAVGDHDLVIGEVVATWSDPDATSLLFVDGAMRASDPEAVPA